MRILWSIYDWMAGHRRIGLGSLIAVTVLLLALVSRVRLREDISDFLPLNSRQQQELKLWQDVSGANRITAIFERHGAAAADSVEQLTGAVDRFVAAIEERDTANWVQNLTAQADLSTAEQTLRFVYNNIPYFLDDDDYRRIDSLLHTEGYAAKQLEAAREQLMFPMGGLLAGSIRHDPLNLFAPVVSSLQALSAANDFEIYDGYIMTPDRQRAFVTMDSPFGNSETDGNTRLLEFLQKCAETATGETPSVTIHFTGGPVIAVGNASQIKHDSILSITIALVLILALLYYAFRSRRHLLLILASIAWGWLFALACLSIVEAEVSVIVVGISSVIVGIAVNYPLHLIAHLQHTPDMRQALGEVSKPLIVGNITTVGAFLALIPLKSVALRDLGLFSACLLIGTILFVLLWLPLLIKNQENKPDSPPREGLGEVADRQANGSSDFLMRLASVRLDNRKWLVVAIAVLTLFFGYHSLGTTFDTDLNHINYMTDEQRADLNRFGMSKSVECGVNTQRKTPRFLLSDSIQQHRLACWRQFTAANRESLTTLLRNEGPRHGFAEDAFDDFTTILDNDYQPQPLTWFTPLPAPLLMQNIDVKAINSAMLSQLSDNFNYIGWACAAIVFLFLWCSFRSLTLAVLSFLPMAVSWMWILGIMTLCGMQFNIVNIILATFIFGQGDDYTIFMTEGAVYEATHHRPMLATYKRAIMLSALIMFIGIGSLIVARHPALHSLAEVTIVGMSAVVLMAFVLPPVCLRILHKIKKNI